MGEKLFKASCLFKVFGSCYVRAGSERAARKIIAASGARDVEFEKSTAEVDVIESVEETTDEKEA